MSLFDIFSDGNEQEAARLKSQGYQQGQDAASPYYDQGRGALSGAMGNYQKLFDMAGQGSQSVGSGTDFYGGQNGLAGVGAYSDATGAGGADGLARASAMFRAQPGYASGMETGLDALDRRAASRGMLGSGNTGQDTMKFAGDYNDQKFGNYVSRLAPWLGYANTAAGQRAGQQQAGWANDTARQGQNYQLGMGAAGGMGNLAGGLNNSYMNQGQMAYGVKTGQGDTNAAYELGKDATGMNQINAIGKVVDWGAKAAGMGF